MLLQLPEYENATIVRSRNSDKLDKCDIVVDVGSVFDQSKNRFDHHQNTFKETFSSLRPDLKTEWNIRLSSAGLVYVFFGEEVIKSVLKKYKQIELPQSEIQTIYKKVYDSLISEIDAIDNGVKMFEGVEPLYHISTHLSSRVGNFNSNWNSEEKEDENANFEKAKEYVGKEFLDKIFYYASVWWPARSIVRDAVNNRLKVHKSGEILELERICPWKQHFFDLEKEMDLGENIKYAIWFNKENDWRVAGVPVNSSSFECRKFLHPKWRGVRDEELADISGIKDAGFVHNTGFIGGAKTREAVLEMAAKSIEA
jgi:uncharacterized UPF0160 family protein